MKRKRSRFYDLPAESPRKATRLAKRAKASRPKPRRAAVLFAVPEGMRRCPSCKQVLPLESFYRNTRKNAYSSKCRDCLIEYAREWAKKNREYLRRWRAANRRRWIEYRRRALSTPEARAKQQARSDFNVAVRRGRINRPSECSACGVKCRPEGHHDDYAKPLHVKWLCRPCHSLAHRLARRAKKTVDTS